jgi:hypothetical protein
MTGLRLLKKDLFGEVWLGADGDETVILRDNRPARWWQNLTAQTTTLAQLAWHAP